MLMCSFKKLYHKIGYIKRCLQARMMYINSCVNNQFLEPGFYYVITVSKRTFIVKSNSPKSYVDMIVGTDDYFFVKWPIHVIGKNAESTLSAQIMMSTSDGDFRYFNYLENYTFKLFVDENIRLLFEKANHIFSMVFQTTIITINEQYCIEKMISSVSRRHWTVQNIRDHFTEVVMKYIDYISICNKNGHHQKDDRVYPIKNIISSSEEFRSVYEHLFSYIGYIEDYDLYFCHSDLHFGNTLFSDKQWYLIDIENARNEVFYYDFFNIIFVDFVDNKSSYLIDSYINGAPWVIDLISCLFKAAGTIFRSDKRIRYLYLFLYYRLLFYVGRAYNDNCNQFVNLTTKYIKRTNLVLNYIESK